MKASGLGIPAVDMLLVHLPYYIRFIAVYSNILGIFDIRGVGRFDIRGRGLRSWQFMPQHFEAKAA